MKQTLSKMLLSSVALGMISGVFADTTQVQYTNDDSMQSRVITPNAGPRVTNGADVFITADFIYWTARQDGLAYSRTGVISADDALVGVPVGSGSTQFTSNKYDPGFKVGIGLDLGHDGWDVLLNYTWLHSNQSSSLSTPASGTVNPQLPLWDIAGITASDNSDTILGYDLGSAKWNLRFNNFDLELGRNYYVSQYLTLRPHAGFKGMWYTQHYNVSYTGINDASTTLDATDFETAKMAITQKTWGIGVRTGLDTGWYFSKNWCLFNETALSLMWGRFNVARADSLVVSTTPTLDQVGVANTAAVFHTVKPVLETAIGIRYDYWFSDDNYHFGFDVAWEEQLWLNQNEFFKLADGYGQHGDLSFQGLTVHVRFDF